MRFANAARTLLRVAALAALAAGCDDENRDGISKDDAGTDTDADADSDADSDTDSDSDGDECSEEAKLVYVIDSSGYLRRFDPLEPGFEVVGPVSCESGGSPFSMAVSRNDKAYVLFWNSTSGVALNRVSIHTAECEEAVPFEFGQYDFNVFGMGYATDGPDTTEETLYVGKADFLSADGSQLASIDTETWELTPIGPISGSPELTGNQNGELWAFFAWTSTPKVAQLDKATGYESNTVYLDELGENAAFAFAYWGGDFYLFHAPEDENTTVYRLHDGEIEVWVDQTETGFSVVGAGVSTCAPTVIE